MQVVLSMYESRGDDEPMVGDTRVMATGVWR